ncbi:MAG: hypothetical protein ACPF9D_06680, partial [Owenweeksia sp.]
LSISLLVVRSARLRAQYPGNDENLKRWMSGWIAVWTTDCVETIIDRYPPLVNFLSIPAMNADSVMVCLDSYNYISANFPPAAKIIELATISAKIPLVRDLG